MNLQSIQDFLKGILPPDYYAKVDKLINENKDQVNMYIQNGDYAGLLSYIQSKMRGHPSPSPAPSSSLWWIFMVIVLIIFIGVFAALAMKKV
jgi:hypothetical protein